MLSSWRSVKPDAVTGLSWEVEWMSGRRRRYKDVEGRGGTVWMIILLHKRCSVNVVGAKAKAR